MINYDSIISVFNEKGTLLKWLKNVEKALKESVLTNVEVLQGQGNSFAFKFTFQDNTSITTDYVTIDPNITATLLQNYIDGSDTIVVDLNELQNKLIVKLDEEYKKTLATKSEVATKQDIITDSADIVKQGTGLVFSNSAEAQIASMLADIEDNKTAIATKQNNIVDSEEIVKHAGEADKLYLNNNISNKINNSMQLPTTSPTSTELVGIDTNKSQVNIGIGSGLSLENGTLKATGGGGGGGGGTTTQEVLWTNPNPNQGFVAQSVNLSDNYTNYDILVFTFYNGESRDKYQYTFYTKNANSGTIVVVDSNNLQYSTPNWYGRRNFTLNGNVCTFTQGAANISIANDVAKPIQIVGLKFLDTLNYSTEEQYTGKHWIDGKKIYQKTFICGSATSNKDLTVNVSNVDYITSINGTAKTTSNLFIALGYNNSGSTEHCYNLYVEDITETTLRLSINLGRGVPTSSMYITLQYTKTTE